MNLKNTLKIPPPHLLKIWFDVFEIAMVVVVVVV